MLAKKKSIFFFLRLASGFNLRHKLYFLPYSKLSPSGDVHASFSFFTPYSLPPLPSPTKSSQALLCGPLEIAIFFHMLTFLTTLRVLVMGSYFKPSQTESFSWGFGLGARGKSLFSLAGKPGIC